jgi:hypothetical protein
VALSLTVSVPVPVSMALYVPVSVPVSRGIRTVVEVSVSPPDVGVDTDVTVSASPLRSSKPILPQPTRMNISANQSISEAKQIFMTIVVAY